MPCDIPDEQMGRIISAISLPESWQDRLLARLHLEDEAKRVEKERKETEQRLRKLRQVYLDNLLSLEEYQRQKRQLNQALESLVAPEANAAEAAGNLMQRLPERWEGANLGERQQLLTTMLDGAYVDAKREKQIVALKPKPAFKALFQIATTKGGSGIILYNEKTLAAGESPDDNTPCSWWRRGRVFWTQLGTLFVWPSRYSQLDANMCFVLYYRTVDYQSQEPLTLFKGHLGIIYFTQG
jgi:hypothetical protein